MKALEEVVVDYYQFELSLTPAEQNVRIACEKRSKEREAKWRAWAERGQLPGPAVLKRAVRKASPGDQQMPRSKSRFACCGP